MAIAVFTSRRRETPTGPQEINWSHPLAVYLASAIWFNQGIGYPINLVTGRLLTPIGGTMPSGGTRGGMSGKNLTASTRAMSDLGDPNLGFPVNSTFNGITVFARIVHHTTPGSNGHFFGMFYDGSFNAPYAVGYFDSGGGNLRFVGNDNSTFVALDTGAGFTLNKPQTYSGHISSVGQNFTINGKRVIDNSTSVPLSKTSSQTYVGAGDVGQLGVNPNSIIDIGYVFRGPQMKGAGIEELHDNPFALLRPVTSLRRYAFKAATLSSVDATAGAYAISGAPASLLHAATILNTSAGAYAITGASINTIKALDLALTAGAYAISGVSAPGSLTSRSSVRRIVFVQAEGKTAGTGATSVSTDAFTSGTGNLLVVAVTDNVRLITGTPVTDNKGNEFKLSWVRDTAGATSPKALYYATNIVAGAGHVVTFTPQGGTDPCAIAVAEFSGIEGDAPLDQVATAASATHPHVSGDLTTTSPAEQLLIGSAEDHDQQVIPPASAPGFFTDVVALSAGGGEGVLASYAIVAEKGAYRFEYTFENGGTDADGCGIATFKGTDPAFVQSVYVQGVLTATTAPITTTPGNFLVVLASQNFGAFTVPVTDNRGNVWQTAWAANKAACFYTENIDGAAGHTFSIAITDNGNPILNKVVIAVMEFSGVDGASSLDKTASATTTSEPRSSGATSLTSQESELLIAGGGVSNLGNIPYSTINGDWTDVVAIRPVISTGERGIILSYRITTEPGTYGYGFCNGRLTAQNVGIATFRTAPHTIPDGGGVPDGINPNPGDSVCGAEVPLFYCEIQTAVGVKSYSWIDQPINEPTIQRQPRIVAISPLRRELSDWNGRVVINGGSITVTDYAGDIRAMIRSNTIIRKQIDFYLFDAANLQFLESSPAPVPFRVGQYLITSYTLGADMTVTLSFEDRFGGDSLRDLLTKPLPFRTLDTSFNLDLPTGLKGKGEPIPYGVLSDEDVGFPTVQVWYTGPRTMSDTTTWYEGLIAGCATSGPISVWGSDGTLTAEGNPRQVRLDPFYFDTDIAMPGQGTVWTGFFGSQAYRVYNGRRYTVMYFRVGSDVGEAFMLFGTTNGAEGVPVHVNMGGIEDVGDGTGNVITSLFSQWQHLIVNFIEQNHATDENWYDIPLTANSQQYSIIDTESVARATLRSQVRLGGGYLGAFVIGHDLERAPLGEWFQRICLGGDVDMGIDRHGRMFLSMEDPALTPVKHFTIYETLEDTYRPPEKDYGKLANVITVKTIKNLVQMNTSVTLRPSAEEVQASPEWLTFSETADDEASIAALGGNPAGAREFHYEDWVTRDFAQLTQASVQAHRLERSSDGPDFHVVETDLCGMDVELGQQFTITHYAGLYPTVRRVRCTAIELEPPDPFRKTWVVRLFGYDTTNISTPEVTLYILTVTNGSGDGAYAAGTVVTITADAPTGDDVFYRWTGGSGIANRSNSSTTITIPFADTTVVATYIEDATLFTVTVVDGSGDGNYPDAAVVTITADAPHAGYTFYAWTGDVANVDDVSAATTTLTVAAAAAMVTATYAWFGIEIGWDDGPVEDAIIGYAVSWGTSSGVYTDSVIVGLVTDYRLTGLTVGVTYYIVVQAYNSTGYSAYSDEVSDVPTVHVP